MPPKETREWFLTPFNLADNITKTRAAASAALVTGGDLSQ